MEKIRNINDKYFKHDVTSESMRLGAVLAIAGGFLDAYSYVCCDGVFANAQTGNIAILGIAIAAKDIARAIYALLPIVACFLGVLTSAFIKNKYNEKLILLFEIIILAVLSIFINDVSNRVVIVIISFVSSVQINSFRKLVDAPFCTTMCTGNLRTATENLYNGIKNKDSVPIKKAIRLYVIILFFSIGALIGGILTSYFYKSALWFVIPILFVGIIIFFIDDKRQAVSKN